MLGLAANTETFSIRLGWSVPVSQLQAWLDQAAPGESTVYASGADLPRDCDGVKLAAAWQRAGLVQLNQRRDEADRRRWLFLVVRLPDAKAAAPVRAKRTASEDLARVQQRRLLEQLRAAADKGEVCPSRSAMAFALTGQKTLKARNRATYLLGRLVEDGRIAMIPGSQTAAPVVTILAKGRGCGKSTAPAVRGNQGEG